MKPFDGFAEGKLRLTPVPAPFFTELLPEIDHLDELKVSIYVFWRLDRMEGAFRYLRQTDILEDEHFMQGLAAEADQAGQALAEALQRCVQRGTLLETSVTLEKGPEKIYFLNSPKGRAAVQAIARGDWRPSGDPKAPLDLSLDQPNIFQLYEQHIGPLTPMIADTLREAEATYPADWIEEAVRLAVENNVRRWRYVEAILRRWQEEGRDDRKDGRDTEKDRRRYAEWEDS
jgi:DnaD/phage-associated family protein